MAYPKTLLGKVATRTNLLGAWEDVRRNTGPLSHGHSEQTVQDFGHNLRSNIELIRKQLLSNSYQFSLARGVIIPKKGGEPRMLVIQDIQDRVVQRAIARSLETHLIARFKLNNEASFAYLKGKGVQSAIKQMLRHHNDGCIYILEADIQDFFGAVDVPRLLNDILFPYLTDVTINGLITDALTVEIGNRENLPEEDWGNSTGLPQGGYLSPLFSNIYLASFDQFMLSNHYRLIRYADDFIVMCETFEEAEKAFDACQVILEDNLKLTLHPRSDAEISAKTRIVRVCQKPIEFLGVSFNGRRIWPAASKRDGLSKKIGAVCSGTNVKAILTSLHNLLEGWIAAYGFTDINPSYIDKIDNELNASLNKGLRRLKWELKSKSLSHNQRLNSGVLTVKIYLARVRGAMKDKSLLSKYWTK